MKGDFLADYLVTYIDKEIVENFIVDSVINEFSPTK